MKETIRVLYLENIHSGLVTFKKPMHPWSPDKQLLWSQHPSLQGLYIYSFIYYSYSFVLIRNKAYNILALTDFIVTCLEEYYQKRIRNFVHSWNPKARLLTKKKSSEKKGRVKWNIEKLYEIPSMSNKSELFYYVDGINGSCICLIEKLGSFCKRQAAVYFYFDNEILNTPPVTLNSEYSMAKLAFGQKIQPISFYESLLIIIFRHFWNPLRKNYFC